MKKYLVKLIAMLGLIGNIALAEDFNPSNNIRFGVTGNLSRSFLALSHPGLTSSELLRGYNAGFGGYAESALIKFLAIGIKYQMLFELGGSKWSYQDIDATLKFKFGPASATDKHDFYLGLLGGLSIFNDSKKEDKDRFDSANGWNMGINFGSNLYFNENFGWFIDVGYLYRRIGDTKYRDIVLGLNFHEIGTNIGLSLGF